MELKLFREVHQFEEWLNIANYSNYRDGEDEGKIVLTNEFRQEMLEYLQNTINTKDNFYLSYGVPLLLALKNNKDGKIIGTALIRRDEHNICACQVNNIAVSKSFRRKGVGRLMLEEIAKLVHEHSNFKYISLTTSSSQGFYQRIGMQLAGVLNIGDKKRFYFIKQIRG